MSSILIDTSPLTSAHQGRGVGTYTKGLVDTLKQSKVQDIDFIFSDQLQTFSADLYHYPYFDLFFSTLSSHHKPFVVTVHDVIPLLFPQHFPPGLKGKINFYRQRHSLQKASAIITDSQSSKTDIHHHLHFPLKDIHVVYLAANSHFKPENPTDVSKFITKYHLPKKFFAYVGDINYNKNLPFLINCINQIDTPLVIATRSRLDTTITEKQTAMTVSTINTSLKKLKRQDQVRFVNLPDADSLNLLYNAASWYIQPSLAEGFGLPLLEAMQAGTPVIAAHATSLPEIAAATALYFDPTSEDSLLQALHRAEAATSDKLKDLSRQVIRQSHKFSWTQTASDTIKVYQSVLNRS